MFSSFLTRIPYRNAPRRFAALFIFLASMNVAICATKPPDQVITAVAAGDSHTVLLKGDGSVWQCGLSEYRFLGNGAEYENDSPIRLGTGFVKIAAGPEFSLALKADGTLWGWGRNGNGGLWNSLGSSQMTPAQFGEGYVDVYASGEATFAQKADGSIWTLATHFLPEELGGLGPSQSSPNGRGEVVPVKGGYRKVVLGSGFWLGLKADGSLWAAGRNDYGQLGDGTNIKREAAVQIGTGFADVAAGPFHAVALKTDGSVWAWGSQQSGKAGDGTDGNQNTPRLVGRRFRAIAAAEEHSEALKEDGTLWWWGVRWDAPNWKCGRPYIDCNFISDTPRPLMESRGIVSFALGRQHTVAVKRDGSLYASGSNLYGQWCNGKQSGMRPTVLP